MVTAPRVWFITGASSGFGRSMTEMALAKGDIVVATLRKPDAISDLVAKHGTDVLLVLKVDVTKLEDIVAAFQTTKEKYGRLDVVYNNAGYGQITEAEGSSYENARHIMDVNFWGKVTVTREACKFFREVNEPGVGGHILQQSSMFGHSGSPAVAYYCASKHALEGFSEALSKELNPKWNIKITLIAAGFTKTAGVAGNLVHEPVHPAYTDPALPTAAFRNLFVGGSLNIGANVDKMNDAIYRISLVPDPPMRLVLGADAIGMVNQKIESLKKDIEEYKSYSDDLE